MVEKHFINLTNGIDKIKELNEKGIDYSFIRIQSTSLERKDYLKLLVDLDHNLLINLALGNKCIIYDYGTNRKLSKTIYCGIPLIEYILNRYWYNLETKPYRLNRNGSKIIYDVDTLYKGIYNDLFTYNSLKPKLHLKTKLNYYKFFLNSDRVYIQGISESTNNDGKYQYYSDILKQNICKEQ